MKTEQINIRLKSDLAAALDRVAREEALDRATAIRRLLETSIKQWELDHALRGYQTGELSVGRAAEEAGLTHWELIDAARLAGIAHPLTGAEARHRLAELTGRRERTLPDIPPAPGGVLLVGINPAPRSVAVRRVSSSLALFSCCWAARSSRLSVSKSARFSSPNKYQ